MKTSEYAYNMADKMLEYRARTPPPPPDDALRVAAKVVLDRYDADWSPEWLDKLKVSIVALRAALAGGKA